MALTLRAVLSIFVRVAFLLGLSLLVSAWVFRTDMRESARFAPVGIIEFNLPEGRSQGTAFLVGECIVMTNFHVVFGPWYLTALRPPSIAYSGTFTLTQVSLASGEHPTTRAIPVIWGDYMGPSRQFRSPGSDWVVLALEDCLGARHGYLQPYDAVLNDDIPNSGGFSAFGYSAGRQMVDSNCSVRRSEDTVGGATVLSDCAALTGDSGSPIIRRGTGRVVAMISGFQSGAGSGRCNTVNGVVVEDWNADCTNRAVPLTLPLIERIEKVRYAIHVQHLLLHLGYDAGPYGVLDQPLFAKAIGQVEREADMTPSGEVSETLRKILKMRVWKM